jgi:ElaB/YqjD/DUF883 family membrane-anchored ribosome-binding protein
MNPTYPSSSSTTSSDASASQYSSDLTGELSSGLDDTTQGAYQSSRRGQSTGAALRTELSNLKSDLDTLISRATNLSEDELRREYSRLMTKFSSLRSSAKNVAAQANQQINRSMDATSGYIREKPLQSVAVATGIGVVLGMLFNRH